MRKKPILALVAANSGALQNGLLALITTIPSINSTMIAEDVVSAMKLIEIHQPTIVIMDEDLLLVEDSIHQVKEKWPKIRLILLANDAILQKKAKDLDLDAVLIKGFDAKKLIVVIEELVR